MSAPRRPVSLALAALGGQGGGVVSGWLTTVARLEHHLVQATSVPGVAQRTGATLYYFEFYAEADLPGDGRRPVMALMPSPGDVDVVVATEWVEAGRALQRGLVTPERTTLIASTHRAYTISERAAPGDGRADPAPIHEEAARLARRLVTFDMAALAEREGAVISAVILGAIAGGAGLPFAEESYRAAIRAGGIAVQTNLAAFDASLATARAGSAPVPADVVGPAAVLPPTLSAEVRRRVPAQAWATLDHGVERLIDYQDERYAFEYLDRLDRITALETAATGARLTTAVARNLALWMSIEDPFRVAQLKTRPGRVDGIRTHVRAANHQVVDVREYFKPRVEEWCGMLPAGLGRRLMGSPAWRRRLAPLTGARAVRTTTVSGYLLLRTIAGLRRWRRGTLRHALEADEIGAWLAAIGELAPRDYELAVEVAQCQRLVRGYGATYERGLERFRHLLEVARAKQGLPDAAREVAALRVAALAAEV